MPTSASSKLRHVGRSRPRVRAGANLHSLEGIVRGEYRRVEYDASSGAFDAELEWHNSYEGEEHHEGRTFGMRIKIRTFDGEATNSLTGHAARQFYMALRGYYLAVALTAAILNGPRRGAGLSRRRDYRTWVRRPAPVKCRAEREGVATTSFAGRRSRRS